MHLYTMIDITLYHPTKYNITVPFPTEWNELRTSELIHIAQAFFLNTRTEADVFISILQSRIEQSIGLKEAKRIIALLNIDDLATEYNLLSKFYREFNQLTALPFKQYDGYIPEPNFDSLTVGEYEEADQQLHQFLQEKNNTYAIELARIVFRTEKNPLKEHEALVVALWFIGCKNQLLHIFPLLFNSSGESDETPSPYDPMALTRLIHAGAGPKNGTRPQIRATLLKEFLYECQLQAEQPLPNGSD